MTFNQEFFDASVRHQIDLLRFGSGVARKVNAILDETRADLRKQVERRLGKVTGISGASLKRLRELERAIDQTRSGAWNDVTESWTRTAVEVALEEPLFMAGVATRILPVQLDLVQPSAATLRALATSRPFQGRHLKEWAQSAQRADLQRIHSQIRIGMVQGEGARDIAARVFGARGAMSITRNQAEAVTRTVINGVSNAAQQEFLRENSDLFDAEQYVATLDARTCWSPETLITMADGAMIPIGQLRDGDWVIGGTSGRPCRVIGITSSCEPSSVAIYLEDEFSGRTTREHRLLTPGGWRRAESFGLLADVPEREVVCRRHVAPCETDARARAVARWRGDNGCHQAVRATGADDTGDMLLERGGIRTGGGVHSSAQDAGAAWLQRDAGRARCHRAAGSHSTRCGKALERTVPYGPGVSCDHETRVRGVGPEDIRQEQGLLRDRAWPGPDAVAQRQRLARERHGRQSQAEDTSHALEAFRGQQQAMGECGRAPEDERGSRGEAGAAAQGSRVGQEEGRESCCCNAREVAGPGVSCQDACPCGFSREESQIEGEWFEGTGQALAEEGTERRRIRAELAGPTEIVSLSIEGDESYVAGGIIVHNTPICRALDGKQFPVGKGPVPPQHVGCRSLRVAVLDGEVIGERPFKAGTEQQMLREYGAANGLGKLGSRDDLPKGHKSKFDQFSRRRMRELTGQVPAKTTYQEWLAKQPAEIQDDILGPTRGKLFREGGLTLDRFVNRDGDELTLDELRRRNREAFERAGLGGRETGRQRAERERAERAERERQERERLRIEAERAERARKEAEAAAARAEAERREAEARARREAEARAEAERQAAIARQDAERARRAQLVAGIGLGPGVNPSMRAAISDHVARIAPRGMGDAGPVAFEVRRGSTVPFPDDPSRQVNGYYDPLSGTGKMTLADRPTFDGKPHTSRSWSIGEGARNSQERIERLITHEYGHHLHMRNDLPTYQTIQRAYDESVPVRSALMRQGRAPKLNAASDPEMAPSIYGAENKWEFWAESFAAWHHEHEWLRQNRPIAYKMVEDVLALLEGVK